jgi:phospholipid-binding lipoprotein MlaA
MPPIATTARLLLALLLAVLAAGCATTGSDPRDPWEGLNRKTFAFNDKLDQAVLKPLAQGYEKVVPVPARTGISNFFSNLEDVGTSLNNLAQGKFEEGVNDFGRVLLNSTFGIGGLVDIATPAGMEKHYEDFGQTLGWWGVQSGPYLVIPLLGPSTARDGPAKVVDPAWYWPRLLDNDPLYWGLWGLDKVRTRASLLQAEGVLEQAALDRYTFIRDAWLQRRRSQVYDGHPPPEKEDE